ncbi:hypothetical protein HDV01_001028 [Terramyces sp. JEL0728]|nr:hypothetical protein HDV01_001028 [Terramyces sp. JEL0728]
MNDKIANCVVAKFNKLKKTGKPTANQWTVLAGIVEYNDADMRCVAIGTGTKCLPKSKLETGGRVVFDSHAEVLARRCLKRYLLSSTDQLPDAKYAMYTSHAPCGDASQIQLELEFQSNTGRSVDCASNNPLENESESNINPEEPHSGSEHPKKKIKVDGLQRGRDGHTLVGNLRTKPGRTDAEPTLQMSCSDKLALWIYCGFGGSLTNCSLTHLIIGDHFHPYIQESLITRTGAEPITIESTFIVFQHAKAGSKAPADSSITWCLGSEQQVLVNGRKQGAAKKNGEWPEKSNSMVCKYELGKLVGKGNYLQMKRANIKYQDRKNELLDETLTYYVIAYLKQHNFTDQQLLEYSNNLEIHVISTFGEVDSAIIQTQFITKEKGSKIADKFASLGIEIPAIPTVGKDDQVLFSEYYNNLTPLVNSKYVLFPISSEIDIGRKRASQSLKTRMTLTCHVSEIYSEQTTEICDPEDFDGINAFAGLLKNEMVGEVPKLAIPNNYRPIFDNTIEVLKKHCSKILPILPLLNSFISVSSFSNFNSLLSLTVQSPIKLEIQDIQVDMPGTLINTLSRFPMVLEPEDQLNILFNIRLLNNDLDTEKTNLSMSDMFVSSSRKSITFSIKCKLDKIINSNFCTRLALSQDGGLLTKDNIQLNHGRLFESAFKQKEVIPFVGLQFALSVIPPIKLHRVFSVQLLISNTGLLPRKLSIQIPQQKPKIDNYSFNFYKQKDELIQEYQQLNNSSIICLENLVQIESIPPKSCRLIMLHYIVIQGKNHELPTINVFDLGSNEEFVLKNTLQIYIE